MATKPQYDVDFRYTRGGHGVGVAFYRYRAFSLFDSGHESTMAFMLEGDTLLTAEGDPYRALDGGYYAEDWHPVTQLLYDDSPDDGTIEDMLNDEYPGLLEIVREVLKTHRSHKLALLSGKPIKVPMRRGGSLRALRTPKEDVTRAAQLVRAFLGLRGKDEVGHTVIVHNKPFKALYGTPYSGTVVYETREWVQEFMDWFQDWSEYTLHDEPEIEPLSSYEIAIVPQRFQRHEA